MRAMVTRCDNSRCSRVIYKGDSYFKANIGDVSFDFCPNCIKMHIGACNIRAAEQVLIDNGIDKDEASTVLQALGYVLLDTELYEG